ncbi:MAG: 3-hydroxyacyl-CoA dehydrogenase family protein [Chloroflexota bacterium]|nr:3-hydroxyacyl-CoA dehydrogenase family protein [Chloroflexota bacterium]
MDTTSGAASAEPINRVAVVGAGTMGRQIAALVAASGRNVALHDADPGALERAHPTLRREMATLPIAPQYRHHEHRLPPPPDPDAVLARIRPVADLAVAVDGVDLVIEAVREDIETKRAVFAALDRLAPGAILATNSSSLPSSLLVPAVSDPRRLLNLHFFAPVWVRPMLEIMGCGRTDPAVLAAADRFGRSLGLATVVVRGESKGFVINRVWRAVKREALRVVDEGHADPADVDRLWMFFFGTSVGPFGIMDMVGLDVVADIEASYAAVATDPEDRASPVLHRLVAAGRVGEKSGEGFYRHPSPAYLDPTWLRADNPASSPPAADREEGAARTSGRPPGSAPEV